MSLEDRTNEQIPLSLHEDDFDAAGRLIWPAQLDIDIDGDSSFEPHYWVNISWADSLHDSDTIRLTFAEAGLLHDRLGLILGRSGTEVGG